MAQTAIEIQRTDVVTVEAITRSELDCAVVTAKKYPRDLVKFEKSASAMVTSSNEFAGKCLYAIPRGGKIIVGPSVRFAEVISHTWGNVRSGGRVIEEQDRYVVAQGICFDLEANVTISFEVKRKIVDREGQRFNADMIANTGNAAVAIALRNSILRVVPKSFWGPVYDKVLESVGDPRELPQWRQLAIAWFLKHHELTPQEVCRIVQVGNVDDIGVDQIIQLRGVRTALEENDVTIDEVLRHSKRIPAAPKRASETNGEGRVEVTIQTKPKGKKGKSKPAAKVDPNVAKTVAAAASDGEKKKAGKIEQVKGAGQRIGEKERGAMFSLVANRGFGYDETKAIVAKVLKRHGFAASAEVTKDVYMAICDELRIEQPAGK